MSSRDTLQRFIFEDAHLRGELVHLNSSYQAVLSRHDYPAPIRELLGHTFAATALLGATLKGQGSLTMQIQGQGPVSLLLAQWDAQGYFRGLARYKDQPDYPSSWRELVGNGRLVMTLDADHKGDRYQGIVSLEHDTLAGCLEAYFAQSEQLPTRIWLAADAEAAAGMLLQRMPNDVDDNTWEHSVHLADTLKQDELLTLSNSTLLHRLYHQETVRMFEPRLIGFRCSCSRDRVKGALRQLGEDEVQQLLHEQGTISVDCEFCNAQYRFDAIDVTQLFSPGAPAAPTTRH